MGGCAVLDFRLRPIDVAGFRGRCAIAGEPHNLPVVLLASALVRAEVYRPTVMQLARQHRVYLIEMPGDGRASRLAAPWSLAEYAGWVAAFIDNSGLRGATVIGHSHAGGVALLLAALHPGRAGRVVLVSGIGAGAPFSLWEVLFGQFTATTAVEFALAAREWSRVLYTAFVHSRNFSRQVRRSLGTNLIPYASRVGVPVLLAWGARDRTVPAYCAGLFARNLPDPTIYLSRWGSHTWIITHAEEFADAVAVWTTRCVCQPPSQNEAGRRTACRLL